MFLNQKQRYIKGASIKKQAYKKHLYGKEDNIEDLLMGIEGVAAKCIRNILENGQLPPKDSEEYNLLWIRKGVVSDEKESIVYSPCVTYCFSWRKC